MSPYRLGYVSSCLSLDITASHTMRLALATPKKLEELIALNLSALEQILLFNEAHGIELFRIGSSLVPFASHPKNTVPWWKTFGRDFHEIGKIALRSGQRLSLHPSPAGASLSSARPEVRVAATAEILYGARVLDLLGQDANARVVVHVGGKAPDPVNATIAAHRYLESAPADVLRRIVIEHDDYVWSAREVLPIAEAHGVPFLADNLHNDILPSDPVMPLEELLSVATRQWHALGLRPKHHLASQSKSGRAGAHARRISVKDARAVIEALPAPADLMLEAKDKDLALFALRASRKLPDEESLALMPVSPMLI